MVSVRGDVNVVNPDVVGVFCNPQLVTASKQWTQMITYEHQSHLH
jgi:hypothetical protein